MAASRTTRRSTAEVRKRILAAAEQEFTERGFAGTTLRSVADGAQISPSVLHRHFPSKDELFAATALVPFLDFFDRFAASWQEQVEDPWTAEQLMGALVGELYAHLLRHRLTLVRLVSMPEPDNTGVSEAFRVGLAQVIVNLLPIGEHEAQVRGWFSPEVVHRAVAMTLTLVSGLVLMGRWVEVAGDREQVVGAATRYALHGIRQAAPAEPNATG